MDRCGAFLEAGYAFSVVKLPLQVVARAELYDDNRAVQDSGDSLTVGGGLNASLFEDAARVQLQYLTRRERFGIERDNDGLVLSVQGSF